MVADIRAETYIGLHVKCPKLPTDSNKTSHVCQEVRVEIHEETFTGFHVLHQRSEQKLDLHRYPATASRVTSDKLLRSSRKVSLIIDRNLLTAYQMFLIQV
jgi:hypothetical protein